MNNSIDSVDQVLEILKKKPIDGYEVCLDQSSRFEVESKDGKVDTLEASHSLGMAFRILKDQRIGFSYATFSPSPSMAKDLRESLEQIIDDAIHSGASTAPDLFFDFSPSLKEPHPQLPIFDATLEGVSEKGKIERAKQLEEATRSVDPARINKVRKASYQDGLFQRTLANSNGFRASYASTLISVSVTAIAEESGASEMGWDFDYSHFYNDLEVEEAGRRAGRKALDRLGGRRVASGTYPVLLRNTIASEFLSLLAHSFLADQIQKGKSPLKGKMGEKIFSPLLSIIDDGLHPIGISTSPFDGEGMPSQRTPLICAGEVCGFLYDRYWARREGTSSGRADLSSTGNSRRPGIKSPPIVGTSNFYVEAGTTSFPALLKQLSQGLLVEEVMGLHTVDPISGDFSMGCSGDWIDKGERVHPVKSMAIAGNLFQLFKSVIGVGEDFKFFGGVGSPSILIERMEISGN